jgi:hypothetical protein
MSAPADDDSESTSSKNTEKEEKSSELKRKLEGESDPVKKGIALGTLAVGVYALDRILAEEKTYVLKNNQQIKVKKGFLDDLLE